MGFLAGPVPTLVDTGFAGGRESLVAALAELGVAPSGVGKVLLTSLLPEAVGNVDLFERATVHVVGAPTAEIDLSEHHRALREEIEATALGLIAGPDGHEDWDADAVELALDVYFHGTPDGLPCVPVADGERVVAAGATELTALHAPGVDDYAACWAEAADGVLFGGPTLSREPRPRIRRPVAFTESLGRASMGVPCAVLPGYGVLERSYRTHFRTLNLTVANLVQNMPFALDGPTSAPQIAFHDLGYWPSDVVRFGADVARFRVVLDELVASGVAMRDGDGVWARYSMDRPPRT